MHNNSYNCIYVLKSGCYNTIYICIVYLKTHNHQHEIKNKNKMLFMSLYISKDVKTQGKYA